MDFKKIVASAAILLTVACYAQTTDRHVIENGGTGPLSPLLWVMPVCLHMLFIVRRTLLLRQRKMAESFLLSSMPTAHA